MKSLSAIIIITFFSSAAFAQAVTLDSTFSQDGKAIIAIGDSDDVSFSMELQTDGKVILVGNSYNGTNNDIVLLRYNTDGYLDTSFDSDGIDSIAVGSSGDYGRSVAIQDNGKIIVAGYTWNAGGYDVALVRCNPDGSLDSGFGNNGKVVSMIGTADDRGFAIALQSDNKILVAGFTETGTDYNFALLRYNEIGTFDSSFGTGGKVVTAISTGVDDAYAVVIQPDGKILEAGYAFNGTNDDFAMARYTTNGTLDPTFGTNGIVTTGIGNQHDWILSISLQTDGKILAVGYTGDGGSNDEFALARYNVDGSLDVSFNGDGKVITSFPNGYATAASASILPSGKIIVAGSVVGYGLDFALVQYNADGSLDSSFGSNGKLLTDIDSSDDYARKILVQSDGRIVVSGYSSKNFNEDISIARFLSDLNLGIFNPVSASSLIYPNPIHQTETLEYTLTKNESLTIALYDVNGKLIRNFISNEQRTAGAHKETLNIGALHSGNYFLTISNGSQKMTVKMVKQ
ncbi:MAG TPA: T9SS type A sorting domain-containing protein [Chitinophagales bacterium]|nr:T9SS type A sorting domain-containing protein [Chitinophagales bacterium]